MMNELDRLKSHVEYLRGDHEHCNPWLANTIEKLMEINTEYEKALTEIKDLSLISASAIAFNALRSKME